MKKTFLRSRFSLIFIGIALGYMARFILGAPSEDTAPTRRIEREMIIPAEETIDLPLLNRREWTESKVRGRR